MVVTGLDEEVVEDFTKAANLILCVWVCLVGFQNEHAHPVWVLGDSLNSW